MPSRLSLLFFCLLLIGTACSHAVDSDHSSSMATAPALEMRAFDPGSGSRYPLMLGTRWTYDVISRHRFRADGALEFGPWKTSHYERRESAARILHLEFQDYVETDIVYWSFDRPNAEYPYVSHQRLRQDSAALYRVPITGGIGSPESVEGGAPAPVRYESVMLVYPVHVGARWKPTPLASREFEVEAIEPIHTAIGVIPAARVRSFLQSGFEGTEPDLIWYGSPGVVRRWNRLVRGESEYPVGSGVGETINDEVLTSFVPG